MTSISFSLSGIVVVLDAFSICSLCSLSWSSKSQQSWLMLLLIMKETLLMLFLLTEDHTILVSYIVLLLGMGPSFLLALLAYSTSFPGSRLSHYVFYATLGKILVLFLDLHVMSHMSFMFPSLSTFVMWGVFPLMSLLFLSQQHNVLEGNFQRWCWLVTWWVMDGFLFVLGSSGLLSWWIICLYFSTTLMVPVEAFSLGSLGFPFFVLWWVKAMMQVYVLHINVILGIFFCSLMSVLILLASMLV